MAPEGISACYPSGYTAGKTLSPGICPNGYATREVKTDIGGSKTEATCCPQSFTLNNAMGSTYCWQFYNQAPTTSLQNSIAGSIPTMAHTINDLVTVTLSNSVAIFATPQTTISTTGALAVYAVPIVVQYQTTDVAIISMLLADSNPSPVPTTTNSAALKTARFSPGLSTSAIAGIGFILGTAFLMSAFFVAFMCLRRKEQKATRQDKFSGQTIDRMEIANSSHVTHSRNIELSGQRDPVELPVNEHPQELPEHMSRRSWRRSLTSVFSFTHSARSRPTSEIPPVPAVPTHHLLPPIHRLPPLETGEFSRGFLQRHWRLSITSTQSFLAVSKHSSKRSRRDRPPSPPDTIKE
ncbi:hypothetical protein EG328_007132 [Venturia inaequalis]|uniref:Uncharacterized protein n=1 Tax=Venturia inaequalis TaxID=5025 RepID=A0A8H3UEC6_VENIN|nr:hypothetical protein EG328_007132 [Venturia inaequalis]